MNLKYTPREVFYKINNKFSVKYKDNLFVINIYYVEYLEKQNSEMLGALIEYHKLSWHVCYEHCGLNVLTSKCDVCKLGEHRIKCQTLLESATGQKIEEILKED